MSWFVWLCVFFFLVRPVIEWVRYFLLWFGAAERNVWWMVALSARCAEGSPFSRGPALAVCPHLPYFPFFLVKWKNFRLIWENSRMFWRPCGGFSREIIWRFWGFSGRESGRARRNWSGGGPKCGNHLTKVGSWWLGPEKKVDDGSMTWWMGCRKWIWNLLARNELTFVTQLSSGHSLIQSSEYLYHNELSDLVLLFSRNVIRTSI